MKIVLISGLSGAGKTVALNALEDSGYYCVDNLPLLLLPDLIQLHEKTGIDRLGISMDIRTGLNIQALQQQIAVCRQEGHQVDVLFLEAQERVLLQRFSETRRSHPLMRESGLSLSEGLQRERESLRDLRESAYCVDTSRLNAYQLRAVLRKWLAVEQQGMLVSIESFGFKYGGIENADFVFDVRSLPNPYYETELRSFSGLDKPIQQYFSKQDCVAEMIDDIAAFLLRYLPKMQTEGRNYVTVAIGCTGGQHRSVFVSEQLKQRLSEQFQTLVQHRSLL